MKNHFTEFDREFLTDFLSQGILLSSLGMFLNTSQDSLGHAAVVWVKVRSTCGWFALCGWVGEPGLVPVGLQAAEV